MTLFVVDYFSGVKEGFTLDDLTSIWVVPGITLELKQIFWGLYVLHMFAWPEGSRNV